MAGLVTVGMTRDTRDVGDEEKPNPYAGTLEDLEREVQAPLEQQVAEQPSTPAAPFGTDWEEQQRQLRMAGGV